jgi:imidazoleglycerol-phosphate dehydratase
VFEVPFTRAMIGTFDVDLTHEFFQGFVNHALVTLHVDNLRGDNAHHQAETVFKAIRARVCGWRPTPDRALAGVVPSTKGPVPLVPGFAGQHGLAYAPRHSVN